MKEINKPFIIVGEYDYISKLFDSYKNLDKYVKYFISKNKSNNKELLDKPFYSFNLLPNIYCNKYTFVIFQSKKFAAIEDELINKYEVKKENIIHGSQWLLNMLKSHSDILIYPKNYRLETCSMCQLKCYGCYMRNNEKEADAGVGKGYLKFEDYKNFIEKNPFIESIEISNNGEPFLNPDLAKIIKYSYEKNIIITCQNGANLNNVSDEVLESLVKYNFKALYLSIDGATNDTYIKYRAGGNLDKVIENIKKINSYKKKYKSEFPRIVWKFILMDHNQHEVEKAIKTTQKLNIEICFAIDYRGFHPKDPDKLTKLTGIDFNCVDEFDDTYCRYMMEWPQINWDGRLLGCCITYKTDWKKNVFKDGLIESLNSNYYRHAIYTLLGDKTDYKEENQCNKHCYTYEYFVAGKNSHIDL